VSPRRSWIEESTDVVVDELSQFDLVASRDHVAAMIRDRVDAVSSQLHVTERTARQYFDDEALRSLARSAAVALAREQPGADLHDEPRTVPMTVNLLCRTIAGLAEAAHIRELITDAVGVHGALQLISLLAQLLHERPDASADPVLLPPAVLTRTIRLLDATAQMLRDGAVVPADVLPESRAALAEAFDTDADVLRVLLAEYGG
jgi:hypothetical protein